MIRKIQLESSKGVDLKHLRDCRIIQERIRSLGYEATLLDCQAFWEWYSGIYAAGWLFLNEDRIDARLVDEFIVEVQEEDEQGF